MRFGDNYRGLGICGVKSSVCFVLKFCTPSLCGAIFQTKYALNLTHDKYLDPCRPGCDLSTWMDLFLGFKVHDFF